MAKSTQDTLGDVVLRRAPTAPAKKSSEPKKTAPNASARINLILLEQLLPDPLNARSLLPLEISDELRSGSLSVEEALTKWWSLAKRSPLLKAQIDELLTLSGSIDEHGQIKPITASWVQGKVGELARIETGHRRYFAVGLTAVQEKAFKTTSIEVRFVEEASWERQRDENETALLVSGVGRAFNVAKDMLHYFEVPYDGHERPYAFARRALELGRIGPGEWPPLEEQLGMQRPHVRRLLNLLQLPDDLLDMADRANLSERTLRDILKKPEKRWPELIQSAVNLAIGIEANDEEASKKKVQTTPAVKAARSGRSFLKLLTDPNIEKQRAKVAAELARQLGKKDKIRQAVIQLEKLARDLNEQSKKLMD